ncbi:MAG: thioredoxin family protein [Candidatus Pacebacteria bacterium]|nr:thioredoxin family protein [Candidatus Paceibacterota bacterium]
MENQIIQVLSSGCPTCKHLLETVKKIVAKLNIDIRVEYITDITKMVEMGVMTSPVLAVNGNPVLTGGGHSDDEIEMKLSKVLFNKKKNDDNNVNESDCCSGCNCK